MGLGDGINLDNFDDNYDGDSLRLRSKETAGFRGARYARVAKQIATEGKWPGFRPEDKKIIKEVTEKIRRKKQRIAQKIGELRSSTSQLAVDIVRFDGIEAKQEQSTLKDDMIQWAAENQEPVNIGYPAVGNGIGGCMPEKGPNTKLSEEEVREMFRALHKENEGFVRGSRESAAGS